MTGVLANITKKYGARYSGYEFGTCTDQFSKSDAGWISLRHRPKLPKRRPIPLRHHKQLSDLLNRVRRQRERELCAHKSASIEFETQFKILADLWEQETRNISSPKVIASHPQVQDIINLGDDVVPLILRRMAHRPWFWFDALMRITKETVDPITPDMYGDMQQMTEAWLKWGVDRGII
jgi:hypothetical protein